MKLEEKLWKTFNKALGQYQLIDEDDKILVGLSGGKDSLCLLEFLARRSKVHVPHFTIEAADRPDPDMLNRAVSTRTPVLIPRSWEEIHPMIRAVSLELKGKQTPKIPFGYRFLETSACPRPLIVGRPDPAA